MKLTGCILFLAMLTGCSTVARPTTELIARENSAAGVATYINGLWLTRSEQGLQFVSGTRHMDKGVFVSTPAANAVTIDLNGRYVVPPYGEAHNHSVDSAATRQAADRYIAEGTFYYKNPNSVYSSTRPALPLWSQPDTLDVSFSYGGLSKDEGHPEKLYRMLKGWGMYSEVDVEGLDGEAFFEVSTLERLENKWPQIVRQDPDFLKLYLLEHDTDENDGLSADVFQDAIRRAEAADLRTTVHVETVQDLALAVTAGATEAAHLPAYNFSIAERALQARVPDALIETMAAQEFIVVTTVNVSRGRDYSDEQMQMVTDRQADNLARMHAAGVPLAIGSDSFQQTAWNEIQSLDLLGIFDDATLFELWIDTPGLSIFPNRAIGYLQPGFEASFLTLNCDPLIDIQCSQQIQLGIKQGLVVINKQ